MRLRPAGSLEARLIARLAAVNLLALAAGFAGLVLKSYRIAHGLSDEGEADVFVGEFLKEAGWAFPLFALGSIALVVVTVRTSLRPVAIASRQAAAIEPGRSDVRLVTDGLPSEVLPFVSAVNAALDRLEQGFEAQRRFTADAAHELRTPLAILTAGLDALPGDAQVAALRADAARMGRLVEQLLRVARLDTLPSARLVRLDLVDLAGGMVAQMAPWAHAQGVAIGFEAARDPVWILGEADLLAGALRNLVENAVWHSPQGDEVVVCVAPEGALAVIDHGPGIAPDHRDRLFDRFWRAPGSREGGVGLGLAIVAAVAQAHGGTVQAGDTPGGGASFRLALKLAS